MLEIGSISSQSSKRRFLQGNDSCLCSMAEWMTDLVFCLGAQNSQSLWVLMGVFTHHSPFLFPFSRCRKYLQSWEGQASRYTRKAFACSAMVSGSYKSPGWLAPLLCLFLFLLETHPTEGQVFALRSWPLTISAFHLKTSRTTYHVR